LCHCVRHGTDEWHPAFYSSETAIYAEFGERGETRTFERAIMKSLIASIFALTLMGAGAANAAIVGVHVGGVGVGVGVHGHSHHYHRPVVRRHRWLIAHRWPGHLCPDSASERSPVKVCVVSRRASRRLGLVRFQAGPEQLRTVSAWASEFDVRQTSFVVAGSRRTTLRRGCVDRFDIVFDENDIWRLSAIAHSFGTFHPWYRHDVITAGEWPCKGDLRVRHAVSLRDWRYGIHDGKILRHVFGRIARISAAPVIRRQFLKAADGAREEATSERAVGHKPDAVFAAGGEDTIMALTDFAIRSLKASERPQKLADGGNMYLYVSPAGGKLWRVNYRFLGKQKMLLRDSMCRPVLAFGRYAYF
jgi:hypothetical protein